jgi:hypothetical protein
MPDRPSSDDLLRSIGKTLDLLVKLKLREARGDRTLKDMILELHACGCGAMEIARLLGTTRETVAPILSRAGRTSRRLMTPKP